jgi:hypothetical protein
MQPRMNFRANAKMRFQSFFMLTTGRSSSPGRRSVWTGFWSACTATRIERHAIAPPAHSDQQADNGNDSEQLQRYQPRIVEPAVEHPQLRHESEREHRNATAQGRVMPFPYTGEKAASVPSVCRTVRLPPSQPGVCPYIALTIVWVSLEVASGSPS